MSEINVRTFETTCPRIYAYTTPGVTYHEGWLKIGYTATQTVDERIKQINHTGWIIYSTEWVHPAPFDETLNRQLTDIDFHRFLTGKYKIPRAADDLEWFKIDAATAKKYLEEFCAGKTYRSLPPPADSDDYTLREEQREAVTQTVDYWLDDEKSREFLWNAKPRFGKNLAAYEFIKECDAEKVLILTNRPAIADGWYKDFKRFIKKNSARNYIFTSNTAKLGTPFDGKLEDRQRLIAFISLQDLKGAEIFGGKFSKKLDWIKSFHWDILIVDESHEGVATDKTAYAFEQIKRDFTLYLSGTPFRAIAKGAFDAEQIYNWSYLNEQNAKREYPDEPNPYADLPRMNLFSYKLSDIILDKISEGTILDGENIDYAFDLNEFFRTDRGKFLHEDDVKKFLDALTHNEKFPFSTPELRAELKHTFWLLHRVESAKALAKLLQNHPVFSEYKIIVAAGDGKVDESDLKLNEKSLARVKEAIAAKDKTITLSVGQLTTGVTVPEWTAVLMLSDIKSATLYIQAAFRAQNPCVVGNMHKTNCYVFDFNPARTLQIYSEFADSLNSIVNRTPLKNIEELLNFFPVLAEDDNGKMIPLDAKKVMSLPQTLKVNQVVERGFMDPNLFNPDSIVHVFGATPKLLEILNKIPRDDSPDKKSTITISPSEFEVTPESVIKKTHGIFGKKKYQHSENIPASQIAQEIVDAVKAEYPLTKAQADSLAKKIDRQLADDTSAENIERVQRETIEQLETKKADEAKRKKDSEIRARLRGFARTVPSFIMAFGTRNLTLASFDKHIDPEIFLEVTSITLAEFRTLRDAGVFNENVFNGAIQKFLDLKDELADYFAEGHDKDIFSYIPPQNTRQIFTPRRVVIEMIDALEREHPSAFNDPTQKFIDPYMKSGMFIAEIVKRLFRSPALKNIFPDDEERLAHILTQQVYGFAPTEIIRRIATGYIFGSRNIPAANFVTADITAAILSDTLDAVIKKNFSIKVTVLNTDRVKKFGEVFTPPEIVNEMLDAPELADIWLNPDAKILEPTAGTGAFLVGILKRKLRHAHSNGAKFRALASIYGVELQLDNLDAAKDAMAQSFADTFNYFPSYYKDLMWQILNANIVQGDILTEHDYHQLPVTFHHWTLDTGSLVRGKDFSYAYLNFDRQFILIVGNPPYQLDTKGDNKTYAAPVYHKFLESFWERCDRVMMIHPARCLFRAGGTDKKFIDRLLNDKHVKIIRYEPDCKKIFEKLDIKGGVAITYRDAEKSFGAIKVYIPFPELKSIFDKVTQRDDFKPLSEIMRGQMTYRLSVKAYEDFPDLPQRLPKRTDTAIRTNVFEVLPEIFLEDKPNDNREYFQIEGLYKMKRARRFVRQIYMIDIPEFHTHKVFIPAAHGSGALGENGPTMLVGSPLVGATQTFITLGAFDSGAEAESALKYVKTRFARAMLGILKVTQHNPPETWKYVPQQDFGAGSDVPWELPVAQIDEYLYKKYNLSAEEINFIESNVKEML
ncbi:MAG: Eco57I restriction-modification methylase domain-containing protein [Selenomonadaceae bacterium]|nr:Eco57I restriction-modification methylase domain-containing protein [Selenomonadaceae bacterium]